MLTLQWRAHQIPELTHLVEDHLAHFRHFVDNFKGKVKGGGADGLVGGVVPDAEVAVLEGLFDADTLRGVEGEHLVEKVEGVGVGAGEELLEGDLGHVGEVANVFLCAGRAYPGEGDFAGCAEVVEDLVELVDVVSALEEGLAAEELCEDTAY